MKIKQIVGEHKKGVKAKIYNKKGPEPRHVPKRPQQGPVATAFAETATLGDYQPGRTATIKDPEHGKEYTLDLTKPENMAALHPNDQGQIEFNPDFDPAGGGLGSQAQGQEQTPLQPGAPIQIKTATQEEDIGGDPGDDFIDDVVDHDFERAQGRLRELAGVQAAQQPATQAPAPTVPDLDNPAVTLDSADGFKDAIKKGLGDNADPELAQKIDQLIAVEPDGSVDATKSLSNIMGEFGNALPQLLQMMRDMVVAFKQGMSSPEFRQLDPEVQQSVVDTLKDIEAQIPSMEQQIANYRQHMQQAQQATAQQPAVQESSELTRWLKIAGLK